MARFCLFINVRVYYSTITFDFEKEEDHEFFKVATYRISESRRVFNVLIIACIGNIYTS